MLKYLKEFTAKGLLEQKDGRQIGTLTEKIYTLTEEGKRAFQLPRQLLEMLED